MPIKPRRLTSSHAQTEEIAPRRAIRFLDPLSVRTRVLVAVSLLSLLSLLLAGSVAYALERQRIDRGLDARLIRRHDEAAALAQRGTDPTTGERITSTQGLLRSAMQLAQAGPYEAGLALVGDRLAWTAAPGVNLRPESDPALMRDILATGKDHVVLQTTTTSQAGYRYIVIPMTLGGDPEQGRFVWVINTAGEHRELNRSYQTYTVVGLATIAVIGLVAWLLIGQMLEPISWVRQTAQEINESDLSRRIPVRGKDDLAELTHTVNAMLDRLESTFAAQRELYDDVGHELRTPLTVLRGHLEVVDADNPNDVARARARAVSEVERMARLVEDLITLAKTERPDFIQLHPVDVGALTDEILEKARSLGDRCWMLDDIADVRALLDPQRISQALLELARNAVKFSEPGTTIAMGSAADGERITFWVRDEGRGIPPDQIDHVPNRFGRGNVRGIDGSGLGLAIVTSIAQGHGGNLRIRSTIGQGSTISLDLPQRTPPGDPPPLSTDSTDQFSEDFV